MYKKKKVHFYNPPFCESVNTKFGKLLLELLDKHFTKSTELHQIFNRNSIKISYCCSPNIKAIISGHNKKLLNKPPVEPELCNCKDKKLCHVLNKCKFEKVFYEVIVISVKNDKKFHISDPPKDLSNKDYMNTEHRFPIQARKNPSTAHYSPNMYVSYMI